MKKKKILISIVVILLLVEAISLYLLYKPNNKSKILEDIKTIDVFKEKDKSLAIMVQNEGENDFGWHEAEDRTQWPDKTKYTYVGTECTDSEGVKIPTTSVLTFNETTYTAHIKTKQTIYCTLYFAKGRPALEVLKGHATGGSSATTFTETNVDGMYRYKGTAAQVTNNYICFGTTNIDTCTKTGVDNRDKYLYRIIGITDNNVNTGLELEAGQLKIIRAIPSKTGQAWTSDYESDVQWDSAEVKTCLNGTFLNTIDAEWKTLIDNPLWWIGDKTSTGGTETTSKKSKNYQIGLMYQSDYYNSWTYSSNTNSWLHITNGRSDVSTTYGSTYEWTMTRYGRYLGYFWPWYVDRSGSLSSDSATGTSAVRPVFYLTNEIGLVGEGTETNPFIITSKANA